MRLRVPRGNLFPRSAVQRSVNLDVDHALALTRDVRAAAARYPSTPPEPPPRHSAIDRLSDALDRARGRLHERGTHLADRLERVVHGAETYVADARDADERLARRLENLA